MPAKSVRALAGNSTGHRTHELDQTGIDLTVAVEVGMVLAELLFIRRISETTQITAVDENAARAELALPSQSIPEGVLVYRIFGAFFFGAADKLETALKRLKQELDVLILRMREVLAIDATGPNALEDLHDRLRRKGKHLILSAPHSQPLFAMGRAGFVDRLGKEDICANLDASLTRARVLLPRNHPVGN